MQDLSTGELRDLTPFLKEIPLPPTTKMFERMKALEAACQAAEPDPQKRGPVFVVGEELEIRGGRFQVTKIEPGHLKLKSLPARSA